MTTSGEEGPKPRLGRKRDPSRDQEIRDATLDVLAETGYDGMTVDMVAARARAGKATLYRRWSSKPELVLDAVSCMKAQEAAHSAPPDTGTLRGDLIALIKAPDAARTERKVRVMAGMISMIARNPELAETVQEAIIEPRNSLYRTVFQRAVDRGEISGDIDIEILCDVSVSITSYRLLVQRQPVDRGYMIAVIDGILLPAAGIQVAGPDPAGPDLAGPDLAGPDSVESDPAGTG